jgi:L-threonylcarbamoyladenylate synthase
VITVVLTVDPRSPDASAIAKAAACLRNGGLVAFPTETVYGLGVHALDASAVRRLFDAKSRPASDPLIVHVASLSDVSPLVAEVSPIAESLARRFWPGPLTLVMPKSAQVPGEVTAGRETIGVRVPSHMVAGALLDAASVPIAAPSANLFSRPSPTSAEHVLQDLDGRIDIVIDGGPTHVGVESTVLDISGAVPTILRPGAVTVDMLREVVPSVRTRSITELDVHVAERGMPAPGLLAKHYSPRARLTVYEGESRTVLARMATDADAAIGRGERVGMLLASGESTSFAHFRARIVELAPANNLPAIASRLYSALRELDAAGVDVILARDFGEDTGLGAAVRDRLWRAAAGRIIHS